MFGHFKKDVVKHKQTHTYIHYYFLLRAFVGTKTTTKI